VRWPGQFASGATIDAYATQMDLLPTFCELLGTALPRDRKYDGKSLLSLLKHGEGESPHEYVYHTWDRYTPNPHNRWSIADRRYKLLGMNTRGQPEPAGQLFDLDNDPGETKGIAAAHPEIARRLRDEFLRWFDDVTAGQAYVPAAIPVGHPDEPQVEIQPSWATWKGENVNYTFRGYDWDTIDGWRAKGESATWRLEVLAPGTYDVLASYGCAPNRAGGKLELRIGDARLTHTVRATPSGDVFERRRIGSVTLERGPAELTAEVAEPVAGEFTGGELLRLNRLWLRRVDRAP
jgi:arylsulfatase A